MALESPSESRPALTSSSKVGGVGQSCCSKVLTCSDLETSVVHTGSRDRPLRQIHSGLTSICAYAA
ncbi:hypothetical protein SCLCIDRAFT_1223880 [Scleroderma citrinum Foug A]|uniref:Uncharacterized protein n=1 Tax=Scleroderma citrinum Foug A TaxID=1036808 RepID=A0A0C3D7A9_9AGAM|nr:hypothetical protein SCLCIDRAFT_1223880 [Scleroderma citrinum Foug A]